MKTKIVQHIASSAQHSLSEVETEVVNLRAKYPEIFDGVREGAGLDLAILREKLKQAQDLIELLT